MRGRIWNGQLPVPKEPVRGCDRDLQRGRHAGRQVQLHGVWCVHGGAGYKRHRHKESDPLQKLLLRR